MSDILFISVDISSARFSELQNKHLYTYMHFMTCHFSFLTFLSGGNFACAKNVIIAREIGVGLSNQWSKEKLVIFFSIVKTLCCTVSHKTVQHFLLILICIKLKYLSWLWQTFSCYVLFILQVYLYHKQYFGRGGCLGGTCPAGRICLERDVLKPFASPIKC